MNRCLKCKTENAPDAEYCIKCGFSLWRDAPPADEALEPPTRIMRVVHLHPEVVRVRRGGQATIAAHVHGEAHANVQWEIEGSARSFASLQPTDEGLVIELRPGFDQPAWASPLEVRCLEEGEVAGLATGTVEVIGESEVLGPQPDALPIDPDPSRDARERGWEDPRSEPRLESDADSEPERDPETEHDDEPEPRRPQPVVVRGRSEARGQRTTRVLPTPDQIIRRDRINTSLITQILVLAGCAVFLLLVLVVKHLVSYENGPETLFMATKHGGDGSSPLYLADFWTIVGLAIAIIALVVVSFAGGRRAMMGFAVVLGVLLLAQLIAIAATGHSLREVVHINPRGHEDAHAVGAAFWVSVVAAVVITVAAMAGMVARNRDAGGPA